MKVLFLTHRLPYAPNRGDRVRAYHIARTLVNAGADVELLSLAHDSDEAAQVDRLSAIGVRAHAVQVRRLRNLAAGTISLPGNRPLTHTLLDAPGFSRRVAELVARRRPDVVLAYCSSMARFAFEPPLADFPVVIDLVDVDSAKWNALAAVSSGPKRWIYAREVRHLAEFERFAATRASAIAVVNEREAAALRRIAPDGNILVVPNGVDLGSLRPCNAPTDEPRVVFCGVMNYQPNVDAMLWFVRAVWPLVRARRGDARLTIVGASPTAAISRLATSASGVEVTGTVPNVQPYLWNAAVSIAPLATAQGVQNKVLEAVAAGLPSVITTRVYDGLPAEVTPACQVADAPESFADHVLSLLALSGQARRAVAARANLASLAWDATLAPLHAILQRAARDPAGRLSSEEERAAAVLVQPTI